ncbi:MAG: hypothetical protein HeimC3_14460 [Candidatus Heimdallarchaeota archaeon LC_3]|nr:MAG: hypothetical protein HeimC3_14460 [Candidatus Heimdallarchaeota archaeon LC_3]
MKLVIIMANKTKTVNSSNLIRDLAKWEHIFSTQCAYRSSLKQTNKPICKHLFTNDSECKYFGCPIVQDNYVGFQRDSDTILIISKNAKAEKYIDTWKFETLPENKEEADKQIKKAVKVLHNDIADAALKKFDYLHQITETIRQSEKMESEEENEID